MFMRQSRMVAALLMSCLAVSCATAPVLAPIRPDQTNPERFLCAAAGARPTIPPEAVVNLDAALAAPTVAQAIEIARAQVAAYVASVRQREGVVAHYVLQIEGQLFDCSNNMTWQREFYSRLPR